MSMPKDVPFSLKLDGTPIFAMTAFDFIFVCTVTTLLVAAALAVLLPLPTDGSWMQFTT